MNSEAMKEKAKRLFGQVLKRLGLATEGEIQEALEAQKESGSPLGEELIKKGVVTGEDVSKGLAVQFGMDVVEDLAPYRLGKEVYKTLTYAYAKKHLVLPIYDEEMKMTVAVSDPLNLNVVDELRFLFEKPIHAVYAPKEAILAAIDLRYNREEGEAEEMLAEMGEEDLPEGDVEVYDLLEDAKGESSVVQLLNLILTEAIQQGASDIHFDPSETGLSVRYRIDGVLQNRHMPAKDYRRRLVARIKVMSKLDIAEHRLPQDGRIKLRMGGREIDFRVSTIPVVNGERVVLRVLDKGNVTVGMNHLGMPKSILDPLHRLITIPEGIILVTGPTGSGKTTTLYSALCEVDSDDTNIMTIEDPVEYKLKGIAQMGVRPKIGLTFAAGLRHILRQDPDVIMVGEIRDRETAEIAIQAALTGHLVLSTLHTNDAPSAITRLVDMGIEPYLLSSCVVGVLAQRLVRKICPHCKESYAPSSKEIKEIGKKVSKLYRGKGCKECYQSGYKGRQGVYELMLVDNKVKEQIVKSADAVELRKLALGQGMISLGDCGKGLAASGQTTMAEVWRVTREVDE